MKWEFSHNLLEDNFNNYKEVNISNIRFKKEEIAKDELKFQTFREVEFLNCKFSNANFNLICNTGIDFS